MPPRHGFRSLVSLGRVLNKRADLALTVGSRCSLRRDGNPKLMDYLTLAIPVQIIRCFGHRTFETEGACDSEIVPAVASPLAID